MNNNDKLPKKIIEMREVWKPIPGLEKYHASSLGRIKSFVRKTAKILKPACNDKGYKTVCMNGKSISVHRAVAMAFGMILNSDEVNHIDGNKINNCVENLEKSNRLHNVRHAYSIGLVGPSNGQKNGNSKLSAAEAKQVIKAYHGNEKLTLIGKRFNITKASVCAIGSGVSWKELDNYRAKFKGITRKQKLAAYKKALEGEE